MTYINFNRNPKANPKQSSQNRRPLTLEEILQVANKHADLVTILKNDLQDQRNEKRRSY